MDSKGEGKDDDWGVKGVGLGRSESKSVDEEVYFADDAKGTEYDELPRMVVLSVDLGSATEVPVSSALEIKIAFELDRDVIAGFWTVKFLVDSCDARIVKGLGDTNVDDYFEGENDMYFSCESIDLSGISPSVLSNSGLLICTFMADGREVAAVNCVVNVFKSARTGELVREILSPLG
jgi:hypothetical protein